MKTSNPAHLYDMFKLGWKTGASDRCKHVLDGMSVPHSTEYCRGYRLGKREYKKACETEKKRQQMLRHLR